MPLQRNQNGTNPSPVIRAAANPSYACHDHAGALHERLLFHCVVRDQQRELTLAQNRSNRSLGPAGKFDTPLPNVARQ